MTVEPRSDGAARQWDGAARRARNAPRTALIALIRGYQRLISPVFGERCRYYPSCSEYAVQAIRRFGILRGMVLAAWRLLRCNPLSRGGVDHVEDQRLFKSRRPAATA